MELREYISLLGRERVLIFSVIVGALILGAAFYRLQPREIEATLLLNVGRGGAAPAAESSEYTFDSFYRLQADERFGDTVVRWLESPRITEDIFRQARAEAADRSFDAVRLSSQVISVRYRGSDPEALRDLAAAAVTVLNDYTEALNESREPHWFVVQGSDPVLTDARAPLWKVEAIALFVGAFAALFLALFRYYLNSPSSHAHRH